MSDPKRPAMTAIESEIAQRLAQLGGPPAAPHFNRLTPEQDEAIAHLIEECGELISILAKTQRHGLESQHPFTHEYNWELIENEIGDVLAGIDIALMDIAGLKLDPQRIDAARQRKLQRVKQYMHHLRLP